MPSYIGFPPRAFYSLNNTSIHMPYLLLLPPPLGHKRWPVKHTKQLCTAHFCPQSFGSFHFLQYKTYSESKYLEVTRKNFGFVYVMTRFKIIQIFHRVLTSHVSSRHHQEKKSDIQFQDGRGASIRKTTWTKPVKSYSRAFRPSWGILHDICFFKCLTGVKSIKYGRLIIMDNCG